MHAYPFIPTLIDMFAKCVWPEMKKVRVNWLNLRDIIATFNRKAKQKQKKFTNLFTVSEL
jgi:hypothetical protein